MTFIPIYAPYRILKAKDQGKYPDWATGIPRSTAGKDAYLIAAKHENKFANAFIKGMKDLFTPEIKSNFKKVWPSQSMDKLLGTLTFLNASDVLGDKGWTKVFTRFNSAYKAIIEETVVETSEDTSKKLNLNIVVKATSPIPVVPISPVALNWMEVSSLTLIQEGISPSQMIATRSLLVDRLGRGLRMESVYGEIKANIGLTDKWSNAVQKRMDNMLAEGYSQADAIEAGNKYRSELTGKRAKMIARTETTRAQSEGRRDTWRQLIDDGHLPPEKVEQFFITAPGGCPICDSLSGVVAESIGGEYMSDEGLVGLPVHPH